MAQVLAPRVRIVAAGLIGNMLEWYDFAIYGYLAPVVGQVFFPSDDPGSSLIAAFGAFAAGFLMRPVGAVVLGHIGDRYGRKRVLTYSTVLMAVPTFLVGVLPTAADIGVTAAVLLVVLRMLQGVAVGGEYVSSFIFLAEQAPPRRRNFFASWSMVGGMGGVLLGSGIAALVSSYVTNDQILAGAWRIPFLAGIVVAAIGFFIRRGIVETEFVRDRGMTPLIEATTREWPRILQTWGLNMMTAVFFYITFIYAAAWIVEETNMTHAEALDINTISMLVLLVSLPLAGLVADRIGCRVQLIVMSGACALLAYPLVWMMHHESFWVVLAGQCGLAIVLGFYAGGLPVAMGDLFPRRMRISAAGLGYNASYAVLGGTAPVVAAWLIAETDNAIAFSWYMIATALITFGVTLTLPRLLGSGLDR